jgi:hypothetical protein
MRSTPYADEIVSADVDGYRIEKLFVKDKAREEIRFSWWKEGRFMSRPLDLPEDELLQLFRKAIQEGVFSERFLSDLKQSLASQ